MVQEKEKTRRERDEQRIVHAFVGVSHGVLCINMSWYRIQDNDHWDFLDVMFTAAGFAAPRALTFDRNKRGPEGQWAVDWNALRVSADQLDMAKIDAEDAAEKVRTWMRSKIPEQMFGFRFVVGQYGLG